MDQEEVDVVSPAKSALGVGGWNDKMTRKEDKGKGWI
jgi:hypothetical protein